MEVMQNAGVTLTATPAAGFVFGGWTGACSGTTAACTLQLTAAAQTQASFAPQPPSLALTVSGGGAGGGRVTSTPAGIDCRIESGAATGACSQGFPQGTRVTLIATPIANATFESFTGGCASTTASCEVVVDQPRSAQAVFSVAPTHRPLRVEGRPSTAGGGTITASGTALDCTINNGAANGTCLALIEAGGSVTLTAAPDAQSSFLSWDYGCVGGATVPTCQTTVADALTLQPRWGTRPSGNTSLTVLGNGRALITSAPTGINCTLVPAPGAPTGSCSVSFPAGTEVVLTAAPQSGFTMTGWGGVCTGTQLTCRVVMNTDHTVALALDAPPAPTQLVSIQVPTANLALQRPALVTSTPAGLSCSISSSGVTGTCASRFTLGTNLQLTVSPTTASDMVTLFDQLGVLPEASCRTNPMAPGARACETVVAGDRIVRPVVRRTVRLRVAPDTFAAFNGTGTIRTVTRPTSASPGTGSLPIFGLDCRVTASGTSGTCDVLVAAGEGFEYERSFAAPTVWGQVVQCLGSTLTSLERCSAGAGLTGDSLVLARFSTFPEPMLGLSLGVQEQNPHAPGTQLLGWVRCAPRALCGRDSLPAHLIGRPLFFPLPPGGTDSLDIVPIYDPMTLAPVIAIASSGAVVCNPTPQVAIGCRARPSAGGAGLGFSFTKLPLGELWTTYRMEPISGTTLSGVWAQHSGYSTRAFRCGTATSGAVYAACEFNVSRTFVDAQTVVFASTGAIVMDAYAMPANTLIRSCTTASSGPCSFTIPAGVRQVRITTRR